MAYPASYAPPQWAPQSPYYPAPAPNTAPNYAPLPPYVQQAPYPAPAAGGWRLNTGYYGAPAQPPPKTEEQQRRVELDEIMNEDNGDANKKFLKSPVQWGSVVEIMSQDHVKGDPDEPLPPKGDAWARTASMFRDEAFKTTAGIAFVIASLASAGAITFGILLQRYGTSMLTMSLIAGGILDLFGYIGIAMCICLASTYSSANRNAIIIGLLVLLINVVCGTFAAIGYINFVQARGRDATSQTLGIFGLIIGEVACVASAVAIVRSLARGRRKEHKQ